MKTAIKQSAVAAVGIALILGFGSVTQAGPPPDLMNSIPWLRLDAQKRSPMPATVTGETIRSEPGMWSKVPTHNVTAGQSVVAVPVLTYGVKVIKTSPESKVAPLPRPNPLPTKK